MTREETKKIIRIMCDSYPNYKPANISETVDVWTAMLDGFTYQQISYALKAFILSDTSGFAPSIGQLVQLIRKADESNSEGLTELEAWNMVSKAIRNGTYHAQEEFDKLPALVQKAVGDPGQLRNWAMTDLDSVETVAQSNFLRTYRGLAKREQELQAIPENVRKLMASISCAPKVCKSEQIEVKNG